MHNALHTFSSSALSVHMLCKQWRKTCRFQRLDIKCKSVPSVTFPSWAKKTLSLAVRVLHDFYFEACIHSTHLFKGFMKSTFVKCCCIISEFAFKFYEIKRWLIKLNTSHAIDLNSGFCDCWAQRQGCGSVLWSNMWVNIWAECRQSTFIKNISAAVAVSEF